MIEQFETWLAGSLDEASRIAIFYAIAWIIHRLGERLTEAGIELAA